ncbi:MAG: response regulator [Deinococcota bacterium]|nr:response regulator [Deinococcota bacterium]
MVHQATTTATILLADSDSGRRSVLEMVLSAHNYRVVEVGDGAELLARLRQETPDLIVADAKLPVVSGIDICDRVKRVARLKNVPVMVLADIKDEEAQLGARKVRADYLLTRPLSGKDVGRIVAGMLRSPAS